MYYILHGEAEFLRAQALKQLKDQLGDPQFAELNTTVLDGRRTTFSELRHHADAMPFLTAKRLVIVEGMLTRFDPRAPKPDEDADAPPAESNPELRAELAEYLKVVPTTTELVFYETKALAKNNPILKQAEKDKQTARVLTFAAPPAAELPDWIVAHAQSKGTTIEFSAANDLALYLGADLRALDTELDKLLAYCNSRPIRRDDVRQLVAPAQEQSIFELVDALGQRKTGAAVNLLHDQLRHGAAPLMILGMIVRQYRILLQVKDLAARGLGADAIQKQLGLHPFVTRKTLEQARNYELDRLEAIMSQLLDTDLAIKTSRMEPELALDTLVVALTG